jgi:hypothetical protein
MSPFSSPSVTDRWFRVLLSRRFIVFFYNNDSPSGLSDENMIEDQCKKSRRDAIFIAKQHTEPHTERRRRDIVILLHVIYFASLSTQVPQVPGDSKAPKAFLPPHAATHKNKHHKINSNEYKKYHSITDAVCPDGKND